MKLLAVTVTFHPDITKFRQSVLSYIDDVDHLIVWDNGGVTFNYSPYRLYHIVRNGLMLWKDYRNIPIEKLFPDFTAVNFRILKLTKNMLYVDNHKFLKLWAIIKGYCAGMMYHPAKKTND